jgi:hypothetical protein
MNFKLTSFGKPNAKGQSVLYPGSDKLYAIPKVAVNTFFSRAHPYMQQSCLFQHREIINNINNDKLFVKLLFHHLEHLDCLGERHANRLKSWVRCKVSLSLQTVHFMR